MLGELEVVGEVLRARLRVEVAEPNSLPLSFEKENLPAEQQPPTATSLRAWVDYDEQSSAGRAGKVLVVNSGTFRVEVLVPASLGVRRAVQVGDLVRAAFAPQRLDGGLELMSPSLAKVGKDGARVRWDVSVPWRQVVAGPIAGQTGTTSTRPTIESALELFRTLFRQQVTEASGTWGGLTTYHDDLPADYAATALPWCAVYPKPLGVVDEEHGSPVQVVPMRAIVVAHTALNLGVRGSLVIYDRLVTVFRDRYHSGLAFFSPSIVQVGRSQIGTWQSNIRLPFNIEEARPT